MNNLVLMEFKFTLDLKYNGRALMFSYFVSRRQLHTCVKIMNVNGYPDADMRYNFEM